MRLLSGIPRYLQAQAEQAYYDCGQAATLLTLGQVKQAAEPVLVHALAGKLYLSQSGWLLMSVPNAIGRGAFDALRANGAELPVKDFDASEATYNAHVSVMTQDEVAQIGAHRLTERGHDFHYTLGAVKELAPDGWEGVSKVWVIEIQSPALKALRKSYGLTPLPNGSHEFHITFAVRRKKVLQNNDLAKFEVSRGQTELPKAASVSIARRLLRLIGPR